MSKMYCYGCGEKYVGDNECPSCKATHTVIQPMTIAETIDDVILMICRVANASVEEAIEILKTRADKYLEEQL